MNKILIEVDNINLDLINKLQKVYGLNKNEAVKYYIMDDDLSLYDIKFDDRSIFEPDANSVNRSLKDIIDIIDSMNSNPKIREAVNQLKIDEKITKFRRALNKNSKLSDEV